jgi:hypothetical protein
MHLNYQGVAAEQHGPGSSAAGAPVRARGPKPDWITSQDFGAAGAGNDFASNEGYQMVNLYRRF